MADDTFWSTGGPPAKRKRFSITQGTTKDMVEPSKVEDVRIKAGRGIRVNCQLIEVTVGPEGDKESFHVHEGAICDRSEFFRNAMKPEWASVRPDPRIIDLPDDDPAAFSLYLQFIYSKQLPILSDTHDDMDVSYQGLDMAYGYVLGERLMDREFKNAISDAYVLFARGTPPGRRSYPTNEEVRIIFEGTSERAPLRQLFVDIWCCRGKYEWMEIDDDLPRDFLFEVTKALLKARPSLESMSRPWKNNHLQYHEKDLTASATTGTSQGSGVV
ncbi:hypothetical protein K504DRAFT_492928 [Pleomassaria siparia CBS 279.74]|uniref:BTB domain-containing protein n=1 Tax=Pleomassaria siparia CBS 279.74 TaxID=1314801 RepID=A0A6G1K4T9_9PLEO|nr:hypothetical protein K504DRAFT_492928 [Pleomassaria siparia CBS 279.74]